MVHRENTEDENTGIIGASIQAALEMYKTTKQETYKNFAIDQAAKLKKLQAEIKDGRNKRILSDTQPLTGNRIRISGRAAWSLFPFAT